ncbi:MAG TPA: polyphenol oxidase family protein [Holophaga sp.]|nr:polyphenol oxidase family protein [Holophaga sp.]
MLLPTVPPPFPLRWGFSTRQDDPADLPPVRLKQVHGCGILQARGAAPLAEGDGLWTRTPGVAIGVRVADCVPVLLAGPTPGGPWIAALHAGWRGAVGGILRRAVALYQDLGGAPRDLVWAFGPCIQPCHFEVGPEVVDAARSDAAWHEGLAHPGPKDRPHLDLHGLLRAQALDLGLDPGRDGSLPRCTFCEPEQLFSYRRGDLDGRQWGWAELPTP